MHNATLTLSLAVAFGVMLVIIGKRLKIPSIVLLLAGGVILGPEVLGVVDPSSLASGLETIVSLAVAVILFEGGLTLDLKGYRTSPVVIRRLLTYGSLITWLGTAAAVHWLFGLNLPLSLMAGSLVIVTGPTVVSPLLRRLRLPERLHHVLYWEGVLIDVVGVFVAVLCYEWLTPDPEHPFLEPIARFGLRILIGIGLGVATGFVISFALKKSWVPKEYVNIFVLACALLVFGVAHSFLTESGILAVVVAGLVVGLRQPAQLKYVKRFKLQLTELGIGVLFILLAAQLDLDSFKGWELLAFLGIVMFFIRPLVIWVATRRQGFDLNEKLFLSWIAPRGIVAAAMASLFALRLNEVGYPQAVYLETLTYAVILATVTIQGLSAPFAARVLGLEQPDRRTWLLAGEELLVNAIGRALRRAGAKVVELSGLSVIENTIDMDEPRFADTGAVLCTNTTMFHSLWTATSYGKRIREDACFRWAAVERDGMAEKGRETEAAKNDAGIAVWKNTISAAVVAEGLARGSHSIDVVEISKHDDHGRFDHNLQPLFWVKKGKATIVSNPRDPGPPQGDFAVVLRSPIAGLADLIAHVELVDDAAPTLEQVLERLVQSAKRVHPELLLGELIGGIMERCRTMPVSVGSGIAIPHDYSEAIDASRCFVAVIRNGVTDLPTPDDTPVRIMFLLLSPQGTAPEHLKSLAAISSLVQEPKFIDLLANQTVPGRIAALIRERA